MSVTFNSVELPGASKVSMPADILCNETVLYSGKRHVQSTSVIGDRWEFDCLGLKTERDALIALIGSPYTLAIDGESHTNVYIKSFSRKESDAPGYYHFSIGFVKDTSL